MNKQDAAKANRLKNGDRVHMSLAILRNAGEHGTVIDASSGNGIVVLLDNGETMTDSISYIHKVYE